MKSLAIAAMLAIGAAAPVLADDDPQAMACAQFVTLPVDDQVGVLSTLEPLGDEINASDAGMAKQWAATVSAACRGAPDRLVSDAARSALGD